MQFEYGGGLPKKKEEEEKKIGIGGALAAPVKSTPKAALSSATKNSTAASGGQRIFPAASLASRTQKKEIIPSTDEYKARANAAKQKLASASRKNALSDFHALSQSLGSDQAAAKRIADVNSICTTYFGSTKDKSGMVFQLATSPYSLGEIEDMGKHAASALSRPQLGVGGSLAGSEPEDKSWLGKAWNFVSGGTKGITNIPGISYAVGGTKDLAQELSWMALGGQAPETIQKDIDAYRQRQLEIESAGGPSKYFEKMNGRPPVDAQEVVDYLHETALYDPALMQEAFQATMLMAGAGAPEQMLGAVGKALGGAEKAGGLLSKGLTVEGRMMTATKVGKLGSMAQKAKAAVGVEDAYAGWRIGTQIPKVEKIGLAAGKATIMTIPMIALTPATEKIEYLMSPLRTIEDEAFKMQSNPYLESSVVKDFDTMMDVLSQKTPADNIEFEKMIQQDILDENGEILIPGRGKNLTPTGLDTQDWRQEKRAWYADYRRYGVDIQIALIEAGIPGSKGLPLDGIVQGDGADPRWVAVLETSQRMFADQKDFVRDHPIFGNALEMIGVPITGDWAQAKMTKIFSNGILTGILGGMFLEPIKAMGGAYNAVLSTMTYASVEANDEIYQDLKNRFQEQTDAGDPNVMVTLEALQKRQAELIKRGAFTPDPILLGKTVFGQDVSAALDWSQDHPGAVLAASLIRDIALIPVGPAIKTKILNRPVSRTAAAFSKSFRAGRDAERVIGFVKGKNRLAGIALAEQAMQGSSAGRVVKELDNIYRGEGKGGREFYLGLAKKIREGVDLGDATAVERNTTATGGAAADLLRRVKAVKPRAGLSGVEALASRDGKIATILAKEQKAGLNLIDFDTVAKAHLSSAWGDKKAAIFPHLDDPNLKKPSVVKTSTLNAITKLPDGPLRRFLSVGVRLAEVKPMREVEFEGVYGGSRVYSNALTASGDVRYALEMRGKWIANPAPASRAAIGQAIKERLAVTHQIKKAEETVKPAAGINPDTGALIQEGAVGMPNQLGYTANFGTVESASTTPLRIRTKDVVLGGETIKAMGKFEQVMTKYVVNPERAFARFNNGWNNQLRRITVSTGLFLFPKHAITDSSRSILSAGPGTVFRAPAHAKGFTERLASVKAETANNVRYRLERARASEAHFNIGGSHGITGWTEGRIYVETDPGSGVFKAKNMKTGVNAMRVLATDPLYKVYVEGGLDGMKTWLKDTPEGKAFMARGNHLTNFKKDNAHILEALEIKDPAAILESAVDSYVSLFGEEFFAAWDEVAPNMSVVLRKMALGEIAPTARNIEKALKEINDNAAPGAFENPWMSMPSTTKTPWSQRSTQALMTPNKMNRQATFKKLFNDAFDDLQKKGATADEAALIASDLAELSVGRIHFDLANMAYAEQKYRYAAWFMTKHRLYNKYIFKTISLRPSIAGAADSFYTWLEGENEKQSSLPEWDRSKITIPLGKLPGLPDEWEIRGDIATIFWLSEQTTESPTGLAMEYGVGKVLGSLTGNETLKQQGALLPGTGRWDRAATSFMAAVPILLKAKSEGGIDKQWATDFLDGKGEFAFIPQSARDRIAKAMDLSMMVAMSEGKETTPEQALFTAAWVGLAYETVQGGKVWPGRIVRTGEKQGEEILDKLQKATVEERMQIMKDNPQARYLFGIYSTNAVKQQAIVQGWTAMAKIWEWRANAIDEAYKSGKLLDPGYAKSIYLDADKLIDEIINPDLLVNGEPHPKFNPEFAFVWKDSGMQELTQSEAMKSAFPLIDAKDMLSEAYVPTKIEADKYLAERQEEFSQFCAANGIKSDSSDPHVRWLRKDMVTIPYENYTRHQAEDSWTTGLQNRVADDLARGAGGLAVKKEFLAMIQNKNKIAAFAKGVQSNSKKGYTMTDPLFATMTTAEKTEMGWKSDAETERTWRTYCALLAAQNQYMDRNGIKGTTKRGIELRAAMIEWGNGEAAKSLNFKREWEMAQKPLWDRLSDLGVGSGKTQEDRGWDEFLSEVGSYREELASIWNKYTRSNGVGPGTQTSRPIELEYIPRWAALAKQYPEWYKDFKRSFTWAQFGIGGWHSDDGFGDDLWTNEPKTSVDDFVEDF